METIFMNSENSKTSESHRFRLHLTDKLNLEDPKKNTALANLSIYYTWKNINPEYNKNKFKISTPTWNDTFDLPDGSYKGELLTPETMKLLRSTKKTLAKIKVVKTYPTSNLLKLF